MGCRRGGATRLRGSRLRPLTIALGLLLFCTGCGTLEYKRAWNGFEATGSEFGLEGRWKGEWRSEFNGHSGGLRCMLSEEEDGRFLAWFYSTYGSFLSFQYELLLSATTEGGRTLFRGEQDLGQLVGGLYRYEGRVESDCFHATFSAENGDHGVFDMRRVR